MAKLNQAMQDLLRFNSAILPQKRSGFSKSHSVTTTLDSAYLVPLDWDRVLPGDEKKIRYSGLARMATPIFPTMDEAYLDVWAFYVPDRLWWNHAKEFYGENLDASFNPDGEYEMPSLTPNQYLTKIGQGINEGIGSLNDYLGFPCWDLNGGPEPTNSKFRCSAGLHRSYQLIWNEWFRNSSVQPALRLNTGDDVTDEEWEVIKQIRKVCKMPDFFTTLLREPQAGDSVTLPLGEWAPVVTRVDNVPGSAFPDISYNDGNNVNVVEPVHLFKGYHDLTGVPRTIGNGQGNPLYEYSGNLITDPSYNIDPGLTIPPSIGNLWANLTDVSGATINNLRSAITIQHLLEVDALGGKRYQNLLQAHWGVLVPDATLQRPELLGATRTRIGMRQVLQTSATEEGSPQGNTAAFSLTSVDNEWICNKAFTEPGFIIFLGAIRPVQSYSQGLNPLIRKLNRYDHYYPVFDNLGNQPVEVSSLYFTNTGSGGSPSRAYDETFGYQEAWTEYRIMPNRVTGLMRPDVPGTLSAWNYSVKFDDTPSLTSEFVEEDPGLIERTIAVQSEPQFILDSYFDYIDVKNMSVHSIPGLLRL